MNKKQKTSFLQDGLKIIINNIEKDYEKLLLLFLKFRKKCFECLNYLYFTKYLLKPSYWWKLTNYNRMEIQIVILAGLF